MAHAMRKAWEELTRTPQTQIPTAPDTTTESRATGAAAAAVPTGAIAAAVPKQTQPDPQVVAVRPERQLSQLPLQTASASAWLATEQPDDPDWGTSADAGTGTTRHATEQSHPDEHEAPELNGPGQEMSYVIVNAFLDNVTLESTEAERLIKRVILMTGEVIRPNMLLNIDEVFRPIFFYYPNGLNDRTRGGTPQSQPVYQGVARHSGMATDVPSAWFSYRPMAPDGGCRCTTACYRAAGKAPGAKHIASVHRQLHPQRGRRHTESATLEQEQVQS